MSTESSIIALSPAQWLELKGAVAAHGIVIASDSGSVKYDGVTITWEYNGSALTVSTESIFGFAAHRAMDILTQEISTIKGGQ